MVDYCKKCGSEMKNGAKFCGKCGALVAESAGHRATPTARPSSTGEAPFRTWGSVNRMPEGIALGTDEQIVKNYKIGRYTLRQGSISVIVTNKRVIRYEDSNWLGMKTNCIDEINIDAVNGTSCKMARSASIFGLICAVILIITGFITMSLPRGYGMSPSPIVGIVMIVIGGIIIFNSFRPSLIFSILGAVGSPALQTNVNTMGRLLGRNNTSIFFQFRPTSETTVMLKEIGACVYDLKVLGDAAISKWK